MAVPFVVAKFTDDIPEATPERVKIKAKFLVPELPSANETSLIDTAGGDDV